MAELEGGADGIAFASGLAAVDAITDLLEPGDHLVAADNLYGGTYRLFTTITERHGIEVSFVDAADTGAFENACSDRTRVIFVETPTNPMMRLADLAEVAQVARECGALMVVDNTFLTPVLQRPIDLGADLVLHSTTKYLNGHSDGIGGVIVARDAELGEILHTVQNNVGAILGPFDAYLVLRGLKTLAVRMAVHEGNGRNLAGAKTQQTGFGGMISFDLGSLEKARAFCDGVEIFTLAESLGGVESLVCHPATMTHAAVPASERERLGIGDGLIRLSVGIEDASDLEADIAKGLEAAATV
jgi:cystathionine beta-lyase/cystathionine gamma-synthase